MRVIRLTFGAILAAGVLIGALAAGGHAATVTPTVIQAFSASVTTVTYGTPVTVTGQLTEANEPAVGVPGEPVSIVDTYYTRDTLATVTTDSNGDFTATVTPQYAGYLIATFAGDTATGYEASASPMVRISAQQPLPVPNVTLNPQPASQVNAGANLTFTGKATITIAGQSEPLAGEPVGISTAPYSGEAVQWAVTGSDGTFSFTVPANDGPTWQAFVLPPYYRDSGLPLYREGWSNVELVTVVFKTRVLSFKVPAKAEAHAKYTVSGVVQEWDGTAWTGAPYVTVSGYYQVLPSTKWQPLALGTYADAQGNFSASASISNIGHLRWQIRVPKQAGGFIYEPASSGTQDSWVVDRTYVTQMSGGRVGSYTDIGAIVQDWPWPSGGESFGTVKGVAKLYYHPRGTTKWTYLASATLQARGAVQFVYHRSLSGYFEVVFPAQGNYLGSSGEKKVS